MFWGGQEMLGEQGTRILINKREKGGIEKFRDAFLTGNSQTGLGKPADRYSNSHATYVNPNTNIFPRLTAAFFWRRAILSRNELVALVRRAAIIGSKSFARVSLFSCHFQGAFFAWQVPRVETWLKPWAQLFCPFGFGAQTLYPSLMVTFAG